MSALVPSTCNLSYIAAGLLPADVPTSKACKLLTLIASLPPVSTETVLRPGNLIAVSVSPECIILSGIVRSSVEV